MCINVICLNFSLPINDKEVPVTRESFFFLKSKYDHFDTMAVAIIPKLASSLHFLTRHLAQHVSTRSKTTLIQFSLIYINLLTLVTKAYVGKKINLQKRTHSVEC